MGAGKNFGGGAAAGVYMEEHLPSPLRYLEIRCWNMGIEVHGPVLGVGVQVPRHRRRVVPSRQPQPDRNSRISTGICKDRNTENPLILSTQTTCLSTCIQYTVRSSQRPPKVASLIHAQSSVSFEMHRLHHVGLTRSAGACALAEQRTARGGAFSSRLPAA